MKTPLQIAIDLAPKLPQYERELREILVYAAEHAELPDLLTLGRKFDEVLDGAIRSVPPIPKPLPGNDPEPKPKRTRKRIRKMTAAKGGCRGPRQRPEQS